MLGVCFGCGSGTIRVSRFGLCGGVDWLVGLQRVSLQALIPGGNFGSTGALFWRCGDWALAVLLDGLRLLGFVPMSCFGLWVWFGPSPFLVSFLVGFMPALENGSWVVFYRCVQPLQSLYLVFKTVIFFAD